VSDGVLPSLLVLAVVREQVHDDLVDLAQCTHLLWRVLYRPRDERYIRVRRLGVGVVAPVRPKSGRRRSVHPGTRRTGTGNGRRAGVENGTGRRNGRGGGARSGRKHIRCGFDTAVEKRRGIETGQHMLMAVVIRVT